MPRSPATAPPSAIWNRATLYVESADAQITLLHPPGYDYYRLLRSKLHWGRGAYGGQGDARDGA